MAQQHHMHMYIHALTQPWEEETISDVRFGLWNGRASIEIRKHCSIEDPPAESCVTSAGTNPVLM